MKETDEKPKTEPVLILTESQVNEILEELGKIPLKDGIVLFNKIHNLWNAQNVNGK